MLLFFTIKNDYFYLTIFLIFANGFLITFLGWAGAGHEYFHSTAFTHNGLNRFLFRLFSCATWSNWGWFETSHQLHHKYTLHILDPEGPQKNGFNLQRILWLTLIDVPTLFRRFRILFLNVFGKVPIQNKELSIVLREKSKFIRRIRIGAISVFLFQGILFLLISQFSLVLAVVTAISPFTFPLINKIVEINQHFLMKQHVNNFQQNSRTTRFNPFIEYLYSNMNFHSEHHMFPGVPYYNLPKLNKHLLKQGVVATPAKGILIAARIARSSGYVPGEPIDCLSCYAKCPIAPKV